MAEGSVVTEPIDRESADRPPLMPETTPDFMAPAWAACLHWAIGEAEVRAQFEKESGLRWTPSRHAIDRMVDAATGADKAYVEAFVVWFNENVWGNEPLEEEP